MKIYCDEAGFTGNDLLEKEQFYFVYSGVKLTDEILNEIEDYIYSNYDVQNEEIKGRNIVNSIRGRRVIRDIFEKYSDCVRIVFHDKKYALAAKIVEYGIEPYLSSNYLFYATKLNEFIATYLYASFVTKDESAESFFQEYLNILRGNLSFEDSILKGLETDNPAIKWVTEIATHDPDKIMLEIGGEGEVEKWILDLTTVSLVGILTEWSKNGEELEVICDNSKVFLDNRLFDHLNSMGLTNARAEFLGVPLGFNLKKEIETGDSKDILGLQIADLFASTVYYCLKNNETEFSKEMKAIWLENCLCSPETFCVTPKVVSHREIFEKNKTFYFSFMYSVYLDIIHRRYSTE